MQTITVKQSGFFYKYKSIQSAIDQISDGGTIYVEAGTYDEDIVFGNKDVTLIGRGKVVIRPKTYYSIVTARYGKIVIENIIFEQTKYKNAVFLDKNANVTLRQCTIIGHTKKNENEEVFPAIYVSVDCVVNMEDCTVEARLTNAVLVKGGTVSMTNSKIIGYGLYGEAGSTVHMKGIETVDTSLYAAYIMDSKYSIENVTVFGSEFGVYCTDSEGFLKQITCKKTYKNGICIQGGTAEIVDCYIERSGAVNVDSQSAISAALEVFKKAQVEMKDIVIEEPLGDGMLVKESTAVCDGVRVTGGRIGVIIDVDSIIHMKRMKVENTKYNGFYVKDGTVTLEDAQFTKCVTSHGNKLYPVVYVVDARKTVLKQIQITETDHDGIYITNGADAIVESYDYQGKNVGLYIENAAITMKDISISGSKGGGIHSNESTINGENIVVKDCVQSFKGTSQLYLQQTISAIGFHNSKVELRHVEVVDRTVALFLSNGSSAKFDDVVVAGGIFVLGSLVTIDRCASYEEVQAPIPIRIGGQSRLTIDFVDEDTPIIMNREDVSIFESNLTATPQSVATLVGNDVEDANASPSPEEEENYPSNIIPFQQNHEEE